MVVYYIGDFMYCFNGGGMVIFYVNVGDSVWVRVRLFDGGNGIVWESSFLGFFLYFDL